jgi:GT2 family glycosyltransferase
MLDLPELQRAGPAADPEGPAAAAGHRLSRLGAELILLEVACVAPPPSGSATLRVEGRGIEPPTTAILLGDPATPRLFFVARDPDRLLQRGAACVLERGDVELATFRLGATVPAAALLAVRTAEERIALLRFLLLTCAPLLDASAEASFAGACHALAAAMDPAGTPRARPLCRPGATLSFHAVPRAPRGAWHLLERHRLRRLDPPAEGVIALPGPPATAGALLLPPGPAARPIALDPATAGLPPLRDFLARAFRGGEGGAAKGALAALARDASGAARWAGLLREVQLLAPARPHREMQPTSPVGGALELALSDGAGGLFLAGWLRDPLAMVAGLELRSPFGRRAVPVEALHRVARPDLAAGFAKAAYGAGGVMPGFLAHLPDADHPAVAQWRLGLRLASGEALELVAPPARLAPAAARDLVLRAAHPSALRPGLLEGCIAPAVWHLHAAAMARPGAPEVIRFGAAPRRPRIALVVPLYRNLRFLRFQLAAFARDAALRQAEIVFVLDSPEQRGEVEHLLRGMAALLAPVAPTLVVMPVNRGYASACNAGAAASTGPVIGFLNSDVLPAAPGWTAPLLARLARERKLAAVGPKLLYDDGAIQHAGLLFRRGLDGQWLNDHYFKGFPRATAAASVARRVPGVTGAALFVRRAAFEAAGGFCTDYVIGDFEDSDLCLALRSQGHEIGYEPAAELFHFERQSIADHDGHARSLAGAYNRLLQHRRWDGAIATLMARFGDA